MQGMAISAKVTTINQGAVGTPGKTAMARRGMAKVATARETMVSLTTATASRAMGRATAAGDQQLRPQQLGSGRSGSGSDYSGSGGSFGSSRGGAAGSSSGVGYGGYGGEGSYGSQGWSGHGGWREPYGEGQQYGSSGGYSQGQHRGKGPKNYQRSDERMKEMLCERLHDDPEIDASEVTVTVQGGKITLEGTVDSRRTKNAIEDVAEQLGPQDVQNNLRVQKSGERSGMESSGKSSTATRSSMSTEDGEQSRQKRN